MEENAKVLLSQIGDMLDSGGHQDLALMVRDALCGPDAKFAEFLVSNEIWGSMGSIADHAYGFDKLRRRKFENLLIKLGRLQILAGKTNVRTESWVNAFEQWHKMGLR